MNAIVDCSSSSPPPKWKKVVYGGMQPGFDDNYTDESFLEDMITNANVIKRDIGRAIQDSVSISQYLCIVALVGLVWTHTLRSNLEAQTLLLIDATLIALGFLMVVLAEEILSLCLFLHYVLNISFFTTLLFVLAPIYQTLTRSISSDSIWAISTLLMLVHLFLHDYSSRLVVSSPRLTNCISLNASIVASVFIASRLPSRLLVFAVMLFSLEIFLFAPFFALCIKKYSFSLHLLFSFGLMATALGLLYALHRLLFVVMLGLLFFVSVVCPYWLIRIQEYKFEIHGPWDEAQLCFDVSD